MRASHRILHSLEPHQQVLPTRADVESDPCAGDVHVGQMPGVVAPYLSRQWGVSRRMVDALQKSFTFSIQARSVECFIKVEQIGEGQYGQVNLICSV